jgi:hypothetical protein
MIHLHFWPAEGPAGLHSIVAKLNNRAALQGPAGSRSGALRFDLLAIADGVNYDGGQF